jgi:TPR repeat protein
MYHLGLGVAQDYKEAIKWYLQSAAQGNAKAKYNLEWMYRNEALKLIYHNNEAVKKDASDINVKIK